MSDTDINNIMSAIKNSDERKFVSTFYQVAQAVYQNAVNHGFWEDPNDYQKILLMHCELSEMVEALRGDNPPSKKIPDFSQAEEELADVVIRIMDFAGRKKIRLAEAVLAKHKYNETRPHKHGRNF